MSTPKNPDDIPEDKLEEIIEEVLEEVKEEVEDIVQEREVLGEPTLPADYDPAFTRRVLELDIEDRIDVAAAISRRHDAEDKFYDFLKKEETESLRVPDLARIVDDAVLAMPVEKNPSLVQRAKAWYHRLGPRMKYNSEMIFGSLLEYPGAALGGLIGGSIFAKVDAPRWFEDACNYITRQDIWYVSEMTNGLDFSDTTTTVVSMVTAGAAYWSGALYLRNRDQKSVYEKYPEIKKKDAWSFVGFGLFVGLFGTAIRAYATYKMNEMGAGGTLSALAGTVPSQVFAFTIMNIWGTYAGLVRDEKKLEETIIKIKEKRGELPQLEAPKEKPSDYTPS